MILQTTRHQVCLQIPENPTTTLQGPESRIQPHQIEKKKGVIYKVLCRCSNNTYIGETGRTLDVRLKEHRRAVKVNNSSKL
jgi:hypothetical protein